MPIDNLSPAEYVAGFETANPRTDPPEVGGDVQVAAFNVYNDFTTLVSEDQNARGARTAEALVKFGDEIAATTGSEDILFLGDFNAYTKEDPMQVFADARYTNLVPAYAPGQYTYT